MDAILVHPGKGTDNGGGSLPPLPAITFTGTYEYYYETYDDQLYAEIMMTSSGTLTGDGLTGDFWGIGGGAGGGSGATYSRGGGAGGGSGYTFMVLDVPITGDVVIGAGGRGAMAHADGSPHPGINGGTSSAASTNGIGGVGGAGNATNGTAPGGNGGSAGGSRQEAGASDGGSTTVGIGDGQIMAKFRNANKHNNPGSGGTSDTTTHIGGGGGAGYGGNGGSAVPTSSATGNGGSGYGSGGAGGSGASNNEAGAGGAGTSGIVFCRILL